ncbi:MAG: hypothetical protein EOP53_26160, partial [Sphingobacteriales bacterium]
MKNQNAFCQGRRLSFMVLLILFCGTMILLPGKIYAQENETVFDEIIVTIKGQSIGTAEIPALIIDKDVYLPLTDFFNFLTIKNSLSGTGDSMSGHIMNPKDAYSINRLSNQIHYRDTLTQLGKNDLIFSSNEFYLNTKYLGKIFGLQCAFNFRSLTIDFN